jgi:hypothetical protein
MGPLRRYSRRADINRGKPACPVRAPETHAPALHAAIALSLTGGIPFVPFFCVSARCLAERCHTPPARSPQQNSQTIFWESGKYE